MDLSALTAARGSLSAIDLFCGAGGLSQGLREAGFRLVAAADFDPDACATYRLNFPAAEVVEGDLTDGANHRALLEAAKGESIDLLAGGPPCQAFSQMRNHARLIDDPRNRLYREFVSILAELQPRYLLMENVPGLGQREGGAVRRQIERDLSLGGEYRVSSRVLDAGDFGTPQSRPRLIFMGARQGEIRPEWPVPSGITSAALRLQRSGGRGRRYRLGEPGDRHAEELLGRLIDPGDPGVVSVAQAIGDLTRVGETYHRAPLSAYQEQMRRNSPGPADHVPSRIRPDTVARLRAIPPGGNVHDLPEELMQRYLTGDKWGPAGNGRQLARRHFYAYRRLHPDWLAWTANTKADFAYHYGRPRGLSPREVARLQGFPDRFRFITAPPGTDGQLYGGARHSRYRQIGNAVPPTLAAAAGGAIARAGTGATSCEQDPVPLAA